LAEHKYYCGDCGKELTVDEKPCSRCGSTKRKIHVSLSDSMIGRDSLKGKVRDQTGKIKSKFYARSKISKQGKEAKETLRIDIAGNRKLHHVEEQQKNGCWTVVHHEDEPLKKKQRKET
jgi:hypothetical protein